LYKILTFIPLCQQGWKWRSHNKHLYKVLHFYSIVHLFETCLIQYFEQPFFNSCGLLPAPWINFSHLFVDFIHVHLHNIFRRLLSIRTSLSFHPSLVYDKGIFGGSVVCTNSSLCFLFYCNIPPYLCFYLSFHLSSTHFLTTFHICFNIPHLVVLHL